MRKTFRDAIQIRLNVPRDANMAKRLLAIMLMQNFQDTHKGRELAKRLHIQESELSRYICVRSVPNITRAEQIIAELQKPEPLRLEDLPKTGKPVIMALLAENTPVRQEAA